MVFKTSHQLNRLRIQRVEGVKFACWLSSVLIKLFTCSGCRTGSSWPEPAKWWSVPRQPSGMTAAPSTTRQSAGILCHHYIPTTTTHTAPPAMTKVQQWRRDNNLKSPNQQLNLTPALAPAPSQSSSSWRVEWDQRSSCDYKALKLSSHRRAILPHLWIW